ncbi:MAG: HEAT repeat domain-containing protein [Planctomycetota bacterium]|jgi:hypothetical protein
MWRFDKKRSVIAGTILIVPVVSAFLFFLYGGGDQPGSTASSSDAAEQADPSGSEVAAETLGQPGRQPAPWASSEEGRILIARQSEASGVAPMLRPPVAGSEEWHYQNFTALLYHNPGGYLSDLQAMLSSPGNTTKKVAAIRAWQDSQLEPRLLPLQWACMDLQSDELLRAYAIRELGRLTPRSEDARSILGEFLKTDEPLPGLRASAFYAILRWAEPIELQGYTELLFAENSPIVITEAARGLQFNGSGASKAMLIALQHGHPEPAIRTQLQRIMNAGSGDRGRSR